MLWYKAWLETRWRALFLLTIILFVVAQIHSHSKTANATVTLLHGLEFIWIVNAMSLAGSGIRTDSPFRVLKGIQGSMYFTLSLPMSRLRLLATRAAFGLFEIAAVIIIGCCIAGLAAPELRAQVTLADAIGYAVATFLSCSAVFGISTMFATFLDQQWQIFASMFAIFGGSWIVSQITGSHFDLLPAMSTASPLETHVMPWAAVSASVGICVTCLLAAWQIEKVRQY